MLFRSLANAFKRMLTYVKKKKGYGLAGNQAGLPWRMCVVNFDGVYKLMLNPRVKKSLGDQKSRESCYSVENGHKPMNKQRASYIEVEYEDTKFKTRVIKGHNFRAAILQHELDHLDGKDMRK